MKTIGENIAYYRKQKKLTQEGLAEILSVTAQAVSKWECDSSYPDITVMSNLAKTLGVTVDDILTGEQKIPEVKEAEPEKIDRRIILVEVQTDDTKVTTRFPVSVVKKALANGTLEKLVGDDVYKEVASIEGMIDSGMTGPLVEVDNPEAHVCIKVVDYEN